MFLCWYHGRSVPITPLIYSNVYISYYTCVILTWFHLVLETGCILGSLHFTFPTSLHLPTFLWLPKKTSDFHWKLPFPVRILGSVGPSLILSSRGQEDGVDRRGSFSRLKLVRRFVYLTKLNLFIHDDNGWTKAVGITTTSVDTTKVLIDDTTHLIERWCRGLYGGRNFTFQGKGLQRY